MGLRPRRPRPERVSRRHGRSLSLCGSIPGDFFLSDPLRIAIFVNAVPVASETFILRQITGLIDLGHDVHIFSNTHGDPSVTHESIQRYKLLERTTFVDGPPESVVWEMPVR